MVNKSKKYNDILTIAKELFWKYGFKRVSIEEICREANVSKMTFYKFFPNKIELAKTIFNMVVEDTEKRFRDIMQSDDTPASKLKQVMLLKLEGTNNISPEFMQDFYMGRVPELKTYIEKRTRETWYVLKADYERAQNDGIFRKDFNPELLINIQYKMLELMEDESVTGMFNSPQEMIMEFANLLVYGMLPHD
ncbi:MAG: TetR/AcrR family transcriptional regulator [Bacteroidales bacterium]|nr:TetR/AcrR family transcriptional regulator [Bacteroidales bacterium]